jgi:SanA protein
MFTILPNLKWYLKRIFILILALILFVFGLNAGIHFYARNHIYKDIDKVPPVYTGIVLGAGARNHKVSSVLQDRLETALALYKKGKVKRLLLTGDHGRKDYDEVNTMKDYLVTRGVSEKDIFLDHAGFDTYDSMFRAKELFEVRDAIVITQDFHLNRSVFLARNLGLDANGFAADRRVYSGRKYYAFREKFTVCKAAFDVLFHSKPRFLGEKIPITGDSSLSFDR